MSTNKYLCLYPLQQNFKFCWTLWWTVCWILFSIFMFFFFFFWSWTWISDISGCARGRSQRNLFKHLCSVDQVLLLTRVYTLTLSQTRSGVRIRSGFRIDLIFRARKMTDWIKQTIIVFIYVWGKQHFCNSF